MSPLSNGLLWYARYGPLEPARRSAFRKFCRRNRNREWTIQTRHGFDMVCHIGDSVDNRIYVYREYEPETAEALKTLWCQSDGFVDIGCNIGYFTCLFKRHHPEKPTWAVDPNPAMIERVKQQISLNGFKDVSFHAVAVGDQEGEAEFHIPRDRHSLASMAYRPDRTGSDCQTIRVPVRALDSLLENTPCRKLTIKMDVEGFEPVILHSLSASSFKKIHALIFEFSRHNLERAGADISRLLDFPGIEQFDAFLLNAFEKIPLKDKRALDPFDEANIVLIKTSQI